MPSFQEIAAPAPYRLWQIALGDLPPPEALATLSRAEHERARRFVFEPHRLRFLGAHVALRQILASVTGQPAAELVFDTGPHGKPVLASGACAFNLSDSADVAVVVTAAQGDIGVDVELPRRVSETLALAERFFAPAEHRVVLNAPALERDAVFLRFWTRKEACLKALGSGLSISPETFEAGLTAEPFDTTIPTPSGPATVRVESLPMPGGLMLSIARVLTLAPHRAEA